MDKSSLIPSLVSKISNRLLCSYFFASCVGPSHINLLIYASFFCLLACHFYFAPNERSTGSDWVPSSSSCQELWVLCSSFRLSATLPAYFQANYPSCLERKWSAGKPLPHLPASPPDAAIAACFTFAPDWEKLAEKLMKFSVSAPPDRVLPALTGASLSGKYCNNSTFSFFFLQIWCTGAELISQRASLWSVRRLSMALSFIIKQRCSSRPVLAAAPLWSLKHQVLNAAEWNSKWIFV